MLDCVKEEIPGDIENIVNSELMTEKKEKNFFLKLFDNIIDFFK